MRMSVSKAFSLPVALCLGLAFVGAAYSQAVNYTYDQLGRIIAVTYSDGKQIVYAYDAAGNRTQHVVSASTVNRPPLAANDAKTVTEGAPLTFDPRTNDSDPDGNPLTITNVANGELGTAAVTGGGASITYSPATGRTAGDFITYSIADGNGMSASAQVDLSIVNAPPVPVADTLIINQLQCVDGHSLDPRTNDSDPGNDSFTVTAATNGTKGTATVTGGGTSVRFAMASLQPATDAFTYTITDSEGASAIGTVNVTINTTHQNPTAANDSLGWFIANNADTSRTLDPRFNDNDPEGFPLRVVATTQGTWGSTTILNEGTQVRYTRTSNFPTTAFPNKWDTFTYTVSDNCGGSAVASVSVSVNKHPGGPPGCGGSPCP